jgi:hypothetical protein
VDDGIIFIAVLVFIVMNLSFYFYNAIDISSQKKQNNWLALRNLRFEPDGLKFYEVIWTIFNILFIIFFVCIVLYSM